MYIYINVFSIFVDVYLFYFHNVVLCVVCHSFIHFIQFHTLSLAHFVRCALTINERNLNNEMNYFRSAIFSIMNINCFPCIVVILIMIVNVTIFLHISCSVIIFFLLIFYLFLLLYFCNDVCYAECVVPRLTYLTWRITVVPICTVTD